MVSALLVCIMSLASIGQASSSDQAAAKTLGPKRLAELVAKGEGPYTKLNDNAWSTPYKGKNLPTFTVRIAAAEDGIFFFVDLFDRKTITLSRNLLVKIAELNSDFDYGKIALTKDVLQVRLDVKAKLLDLEEFKALESQIASIADEAYGVLKDFVQ